MTQKCAQLNAPSWYGTPSRVGHGVELFRIDPLARAHLSSGASQAIYVQDVVVLCFALFGIATPANLEAVAQPVLIACPASVRDSLARAISIFRYLVPVLGGWGGRSGG